MFQLTPDFFPSSSAAEKVYLELKSIFFTQSLSPNMKSFIYLATLIY